jgi:HD-like signal output (HDOD) protein
MDKKGTTAQKGAAEDEVAETASQVLRRDSNAIAFGFVQKLASELSSGELSLPSFPEIVVRVQRVMADPNVPLEKVARVVGSEPALTARLLRMANSAALNATGKAVTDLRTAINRMGYEMVRSASVAFAMSQLRYNEKLGAIKNDLDDLWERSMLVAAFALVLARKCTKINPEESMLTGMMHGIGKLYVLTRAVDQPALLLDTATLNQIMTEWHPQIGKSILENWDFPEAVSEAVGNQNDIDRGDRIKTADLCDVLAVSVAMAPLSTDPAGAQLAIRDFPATRRLGLDEATTIAVLQEFAAEVHEVCAALGS